ncbi:MAG: tetratricopeptide repeat protein [Pirellulaceae bacterium]
MWGRQNLAGSAVTHPNAHRRVLGPRLKVVFHIVLAIAAILGANSVYLAAVTCLEWVSRRWGAGLTYQNSFYLLMFLLHILLGLLLILPFLVFGISHLLVARHRRNRRAVRLGYSLFLTALVILVTGLLLVRIVGFFELKAQAARAIVYWLHVICPLFAIWLYWLHRLAGRRIKWRIGIGYAGAVGALALIMVYVQAQDPRDWYAQAPAEGEKYFEPALTRTMNGNFISARTLMMDDYCQKCHADVHAAFQHSQHRLSSFNNPAYLATIVESREVFIKRDGNVQASRWCAGCHDPVPFLSGQFDDPEYDLVNDPTSQAGITCTACHAITHVNSTRGNGDYVMEEPLHYPFAYSDNAVLQFINNTLVKAKPSFHKQTFLKPFHKTAEFCSVCHKVNLPKEVTHYKEFLRGQNHYDNYLLSGVSGVGARSFYYPEKAEHNCNGCHMPLQPSNDFGAKMFPGAEQPSVHNHLFVGANTAVPWLLGFDAAIEAHQEFLQQCVRVDIFGIREEGTIEGKLHAPLRPDVPALQPGQAYLLETVIRTLKVGHLFTQGTVDSNEVWLEVKVTSGDRELGSSGGIDAQHEVDRWAHFVNNFVVDREGNRINRRNAQDIFVALYDHQIAPGSGQTVHYRLQVPPDVTAPVKVELALKYRKFDKEYMEIVGTIHERKNLPRLKNSEPGTPYVNELPITVLARDEIVFPVEGVSESVRNGPRDIPPWQRWNDYGIGMLLKGKAELRQAAEAFSVVERLNRFDGPLNLARVYYREGRLNEAVDALRRAAACQDPPAPPWTLAWLSGLVNREQGHLVEAERDLRSVLEDKTPEMVQRGFDFSRDYVVINELGLTLFTRAQQVLGEGRRAERESLLQQAAAQFEKTLTLDSEDVTAHYNLALIYGLLGDQAQAAEHRQAHQRYKGDDNARDRAIAAARRRYPAANHAAEALVIYPLTCNDREHVEAQTHRRGRPVSTGGTP